MMKIRRSVDMDDLSDEESICSQDTTCSSSGSSMELPPEWEVAFAGNNGRLFYVDNDKKETSWCPPQKAWKCCFHLPPGWEVSIDKENFLYYINHNLKLTSYKHPNYENRQFEFLHQAFQARRRRVSIVRNIRDGFGFVAGSEKPVIIRSVVAGSPADGQLNANDQIFSIGNQIAYNLPQPQVISMIRSCTDVLEMEVVATEDIQDVRNQGQLKSALMSRATRERRKSCPVNVRFEEKPEVLSLPPSNGLSVNIIKQMIPNVLKIYLENGQTKSFQYNAETTVKEIFDSVIERLQIKSWKYFALVLIGPYPNQTIFLQPEDRVTQIVNKKVFSRWECRLELSFSPKNAFDLLEKDPVAFEYWYQQTTSSVVKGHLGSDIKYDVIMRLAALQIHAVMTKENEDSKFSLKDVLKEYGGLEDFLPTDVIFNVKKKEIKKAINGQLKSLERIARPGQKLTALQAKLHYLKIASETSTFGGKTFTATLISPENCSDTTIDSLLDASDVLVSPSQGICTLYSDTGNVLQHLVEFSQVSGIVITSHMLNRHHLKLFIKDKKALSFILSPQDSDDMAFMINGYHKIFCSEQKDLPVFNLSQTIPRYKAPKDGTSKAPPYSGKHDVIPSTWSYIDEVVSTMWLGNNEVGEKDDPRSITLPIDFSYDPPKYGASKICDRSSFVPNPQRAAVDSFIRELSIRDKQKKHLKAVARLQNERRDAKKISPVGQFDTIRFGMDNEVAEEEVDSVGFMDDSVDEQMDLEGDGLTRHVIVCSLSSDEEISDEDITELSKRVNGAGTLSRLMKMNGKRNDIRQFNTNEDDPALGNSRDKAITMKIERSMQNSNIQKNDVKYANDEEDSGWRINDDSDTSSNAGSLARTWSSPWGTFSEEDSTDQESLKEQGDAGSLLSFNEEAAFDKNRLIKDAIAEANSSMEFSPREGFNMANRNSFDKYLVKKELDEVTDERAGDPLNDSSCSDERSAFLLRPLSNESDDVFVDGKNVMNTRTVDVSQNVELNGSTSQVNSAVSVKNIRNMSGSSAGEDKQSSLKLDAKHCHNLLDDRPKSVNLADLNIYIPAPPKMTTKELDPNDLRIPSPPEEFADSEEVASRSEDENEDEELADSNAESSRSSSPDETVEFMDPSLGLKTKTAESNTEDSRCSSSDDEIEFMTKGSVEDSKGRQFKEDGSNSEAGVKSDKLVSDGGAKLPNNSPSKFRDINFRRQTEPTILALDLPKSPLRDFRDQRVGSPLFFAGSQSFPAPSQAHHKKSNSDLDIHYDHSDPFQQLMTNNSPSKSPRLTLPNTPLALRRNQFKEFGSVDNIGSRNSKFNSLPSSFSFEEFNTFVESCKTAVEKSLSLEDQLMKLVENNKQSNRLSFEGEDTERQSFLDVMRTCSRSLANRSKDVILLATNGDLKILGKLVRSSQSEVENLVVAMLTVRESLTLANLVKDVVVDYKDVMACLKKCTGKPITDPDVIKLIEKNDELTFALTILIRGLRSY